MSKRSCFAVGYFHCVSQADPGEWAQEYKIENFADACLQPRSARIGRMFG